MVSSNASLSYEEIIAAAEPTQPLFFQLYKHADNKIAEKRVRTVEQLGYKAIWLTVDALVPGKRERDIRSPWVLDELETGKREVYTDNIEGTESGDAGLGTAGALIANTDLDMTWETVGSMFSQPLLPESKDTSFMNLDNPLVTEHH
jgi:L-lactate dehydrogenase (cytochrome)